MSGGGSDLKLRPTKTREDLGSVTITTEQFSSLSKALDRNLAQTASDDIFRPTANMRRIKAEFYNKIRGMGIDINTLDVERIQKVIRAPELVTWWRNDEFRIWFQNAEEHRVRVRFLMDKHLDNIEDILNNDSGEYTVKDRLAAGKQLLDHNNAFLDEDKADRDQNKALAVSPEKLKQLAAEIIERRKLEEASKSRAIPAPKLPV
jgi:hypothetical protein